MIWHDSNGKEYTDADAARILRRLGMAYPEVALSTGKAVPYNNVCFYPEDYTIAEDTEDEDDSAEWDYPGQ